MTREKAIGEVLEVLRNGNRSDRNLIRYADGTYSLSQSSTAELGFSSWQAIGTKLPYFPEADDADAEYFVDLVDNNSRR